jgi:hypothetical protein
MRVNRVWGCWLRMTIMTGILLSGWVCAAFAQSTIASGSIVGVVTDPSGAAAGGEEVAIRNADTHQRLTFTTTKAGFYSSGPILPGEYTLHVDVKGFASVDFPVTIHVGTTSSGDVRLQPATGDKKKVITRGATIINGAQATVQGVITSHQLENLPVNGRNFLDLAQLEPGVQIRDAASLDPNKNGFFAVSIEGRSGRTTRTLLDGIDISDARSGSTAQNISLRSIQEFQIAQSALDISSAMTSSGTVNAVTRSGSNSYHGGGFYGFRDQKLGFAAFPSGRNPYFQRNQFGGNFGGALIPDKLFFFVDGQRTKQDSRSIPALDYPFNGLGVSYNTPFRDNALLGRLDWTGQNKRLFYRATYDEDSDLGPGTSDSPFLTHNIAPGQAVGADFYRGSFTHSIRFGYNRYSNHLGLPHQSGFVGPTLPFSIQNGSLQIGPNPSAPQATTQSNIQVRYDGSKIWDNHLLRLGGSFSRIAIGGYAALGSFGPTVTEASTFANEQAILGNPNAYAPALNASDAAGQLDNPLNYPVAGIAISNGQGFFSEHSAFGFPHGGQIDNRFELYVGDVWKPKRNLTVNYGLRYLRDSGLTNSDLPGIALLNGFGPGLGNPVRQPNFNFSPQLGVAWAPFSGERTVFRAGAGLYYDSNLFANSLPDRALRLPQGQYYARQPLCGPGEYSVILPNGTALTSSDGLNIASQICGRPLSSVVNGVSVAQAIADLQRTVAAASAVPGANGFYAGRTGSTLGSMLSPNYISPSSFQMNFGWQHQFGHNTVVSLDYVRSAGTHFLLGVDRNHAGDASNLNVNNALAAINRTLAANAPSCGQVTASTSIAGITCYLGHVHGASISDFAVRGLDSSGTFANPTVAFPGDNPSMGQGIFFEPAGNSRYRAVDLAVRSALDHPVRGIRSMNLQFSYSWSKFQSNFPGGDGASSDQDVLANAVDWDNPNRYFGPAGLDRTHQVSFAPTLDLPRGFQLGMAGHFDSPLPLTVFLPQLNGGGVPGEIFRSDVTGDGTVGDVVLGSNVGSFRRGGSVSRLDNAISNYNNSVANHPTPAGTALITNGLFTQTQLLQLGAVTPTLANASPNTGPAWLKTVDLRLARPFMFKERFTVEPSVSAFNVFNSANFDSSLNPSGGVLQPAGSLSNLSLGCGNLSRCGSSRIGPGSGVFSLGSARQLEFGLRLTF